MNDSKLVDMELSTKNSPPGRKGSLDAMRATLAEGEFGPDADELWELDKALGSRKCAISCIGSPGND